MRGIMICCHHSARRARFPVKSLFCRIYVVSFFWGFFGLSGMRGINAKKAKAAIEKSCGIISSSFTMASCRHCKYIRLCCITCGTKLGPMVERFAFSSACRLTGTHEVSTWSETEQIQRVPGFQDIVPSDRLCTGNPASI
jgi:hypothetical protein